MAIELLSTEVSATPYSEEGVFNNPLCFAFDGVMGGVQERKLYLKNTSSTSVTVSVEVINAVANDPYSIYLSANETIWTVETPKLTGVVIPGNSGVQFFYIKMEVTPDSEISSYRQLQLRVEEEV
jgi:hypothetical protein